MDKQLLGKIDTYIKDCRDEITDNVIKLIKVPSICSEAAEGAPYGPMCRKALDVCCEMFHENGFHAEVRGEGRYAVSENGEGEKTIGIFPHSDVVPAGDGWMYCDPFSPVIKDDTVIGRGACDDKCGIVMALYILKMFRDLNIRLKSRLNVVIGSNEETGMEDMVHFARENKMPDLSLVPDSAFPVSAGEKGICRFDAVFSQPFCDILFFEGGSAYNIVLDKLNVKMIYRPALAEALKRIGEKNDAFDVTFDKETIHVTVKGIAKHAATPEGSINAAYLFSAVLSDCEALCENDRKLLKKIEILTAGYDGDGFGIKHTDPLFDELTCVNGICCLVDKKPSVSFDIRYGTSLSHTDLEKKLYEKGEALDFTVVSMNNRQGFILDRDSSIMRTITRVYSEISGNEAAEPFYMKGGTYARVLKNAYSVGTRADYIETKLTLPEGRGGAHQRDEKLDISAFLEAIKINAVMIIECDEELNK